MQRDKSAALPLALLYATLIVYASLFPFTGWRDQGIAPWAYLQAPLPRYWTRFDVGGNLIGYVPLGLLLTLALAFKRRWLAALTAALLAALLSFGMECLQSYLPLRVASNLDLGLNAAGGALGALAAWALERLGVVRRWRLLRARWFGRESRGALVLLALWPVGLLFPAPVAFGLGQVYQRVQTSLSELLADIPFLEWLPLHVPDMQPLAPNAEALCVALGALAPCLLGYTVTQPWNRRAALAAVALLTGVLTSALSSALTHGPVYAWNWIGSPVKLGLTGAAAAAALLLRLPVRGCVALLMAALAAQMLLLNSAPQNAYFAVNLQGWEQGRFIHFHGLAQWVGWLWPYAVLIYLSTRLGRAVDLKADSSEPHADPDHSGSIDS
ncbi:MAG: VanZ family protein [Burkholderiaceae bacterium]|jgi:VanZ family protein|nr:VanZ family protein [Burkholderiaceae bacterium]